ncbi:MAG: TniQ family protein [Faecalimonas sp.]|nr:TniQ family protein [Faecalimonas sp.]
MLYLDYPAIAEGELFYAYCLRWCDYLGITRREERLMLLSSGNKSISNALFHPNISGLLKVLGMSPEEYIQHHSVFPYYRMFVTKSHYQEVIRDMFLEKKYFTAKLSRGFTYTEGSKQKLFYCPACIKEAGSLLGIQRYHQINGVHVCYKHQCRLKSVSGIRSKKVDVSTFDLSVESCADTILNEIARDVAFIVEHDIELDLVRLRKILWERYNKEHLSEKEEEWKNDRTLPKEYQLLLQDFSYKRLIQWRLPNGKIHPIEYLLMIRKWYGSFENFIMEEKITVH